MKQFTVLQCLNVTTRRFITEMDDIYEVMGHVMDEDCISTIGLMMCADSAREGLLNAVPLLVELTAEVNALFESSDDLEALRDMIMSDPRYTQLVEVPRGCGGKFNLGDDLEYLLNRRR